MALSDKVSRLRGKGVLDRDWITIFVLGIAWGSTFFFNEVLLRDMGPLWVSFSRVATAAAGGWLWLAVTGRIAPLGAKTLGQLALMGATMFAVPFAIYPLGQQFVASGVAGIVNALTPVAVVLVSHFWPGGERATPLKVAGVAAGFLGIVLLTIPAMNSRLDGQLFGTLVLVLAPVSYAFAMNYVRRFRAISVDLMVTWAFTFAALLALPVALIAGGVPDTLHAETLGAVAVLGLGLTTTTFMVAFRILPRAGATKTSSVTFIAPISALLIGWLVLDESLGVLHFAGMAAIFLGLALIDGRLFGAPAPAKLN